MPSSLSTARYIVLDWGTTSFRALLVDGDGAVADRIETQDGIQFVPNKNFEAVLGRAIAPWRTAHGLLPILAAGMIGSRNGWVEMPYVDAPAGLDEIASAARRVELADGGSVLFMPGLTDRSAKPFPDVMRGEETQLVGLGLDRDRLVVLPGTHCKWARIGEERILRFRTLVTGEAFANLVAHSFIAQMVKLQPQADWKAFARGLDTARDAAVGTGLLSRLFSVRTGWLAGELKAEEASDYLSGLILGSEFQEVAELGWFEPGGEIVIVGGEHLVERYHHAALAFGLVPRAGPADASLRGCLTIAAHLEGAQHAAR